ncbi:TPA: helix-turn-helix domain-containing protein [Staphylococcus aureus]|uniref:XRE family transcriptional regulator n=1 Tax=Staphylococcus aureus TaxID=1280 RepID=UPI0004534C3C|nr:LexA family transcriptional regulator [Staphylococcus aureus]EZY81257.1 hypothetical protein V066_01068 [Staphylococcus aureus R0615]MCR0867206.1 LexA family transcriptional regulator [Staphylococcus aureus]HCX3191677.1 helix-turn-helix domain-containing protein [Staphylococcus aureus]HDP5872395.1 helix-turn-helix domain-containing protein [Staphylococcus aureus]HDP5911835.1 helix-turn-helix domain-containing protein [Staphylococcus aureus]
MQSELFQQRLKRLRKEKGITLERLAKEIGTTKVTLSRYENGDRSPKLEFVAALSKYFNVEMTWLAGVYEGKVSEIKIDNTLKDNFNKELNKEQDGKHTKPIETFRIQSQLQPPRQQKVLECAEEQLEEQKKEEEEAKVKKSADKTSKSKVAPFKAHVDGIIKEETHEYEEVNVTGFLAAGKGTLNYDKTNPIACTRVRSCEVPDKYDLAFQITGDSMEPHFKDGEIAYVLTDEPFIDKKIYAVEVEHEAYIKKVYKHSDSFTLVSLNNDVDKDGKLLYPDIEVTEDDEFYIIGRVI